MYRIVQLSGNYYGYKFQTDDRDEMMEEIEDFTSQGTAVLIVEDLHDLHDFGIDESEIEMVEPAED